MCKNLRKIDVLEVPRGSRRHLGTFWRPLGASWGRLGASWGRLGGVLGPPGAVFGRSWAVWGASWAVLGRLGGVLVGNMGPTWFPKRSPNRSKIEAKVNQFLNASWDRIFEGFWWIFGWKMEPSWHQNGILNRSYLEIASNQKNIIIPV